MKSLSNAVTGFALLALIVTCALVIRARDWYTPGSDLGYNLGLFGGVLMLLLLVYPLKKRIKFMQRMGNIKPWFLFHMFCGIMGPLAIIFHSTFKIGSDNAMVAMVSMLLVAGSGVIGRYIYVRIYDGFTNRELKLDELEGDEESQSLNITRDMQWAPDVVEALVDFRKQVRSPSRGALGGAVKFILLPWREWKVRRSCHAALAKHLNTRATARQWDPKKRELRGRQFNGLVAKYTTIVKRTAQYDAFKRMFAWWHILHLPFVYLLAASAAYHVVAVHMY